MEPLPEEELQAAAEEFVAWALEALQGQLPSQRELAKRLGWPASTLSSYLRGNLTLARWAQICRALGRDPIDELVRGREELRRAEEERRQAEDERRRAEDSDRETSYRRMLERAEADTMVAFWKRLPADDQARVLDELNRFAGPSAESRLEDGGEAR